METDDTMKNFTFNLIFQPYEMIIFMERILEIYCTVIRKDASSKPRPRVEWG